MNKKLLNIGLLAVMLFPSCVSYTKTVGEEPIQKRFQSGETARVFYEAIFVSDETITPDNDQAITIRAISPISWHKRINDHKKVNDAFRSADINKNGTLSLKEAQSFDKQPTFFARSDLHNNYVETPRKKHSALQVCNLVTFNIHF